MTIRMLQAWNGYPQQAVVSMSASEESRLVGLGIATYDLDGPAENLRMAQLATDAAGNAINFISCDGSVLSARRSATFSQRTTRVPAQKWATGTNGAGGYTYQVVAAAEAPFNAFRMLLVNNESGTVTVDGANYGVNTQASSNTPLSYRAVTWDSGSASVVLAARTAVDRPSLKWSDWMMRSSIDRTDGGSKHLLYMRAHIAAASTAYSETVDDMTWLATESSGRIWKSFRQNVDGVTTPANFTDFNTYGKNFIAGVQFAHYGRGITVAVIGDSLQAGSNGSDATYGYGNGYIHRAIKSLSNSGMPITLLNGGWGGTTSGTYYLRALDILNTLRPDVLIYSPFSCNSGTPTSTTIEFELFRMGIVLSTAADLQIPVILTTGIPNTSLGWNAAADAYRIELNNKLLNYGLAAGAIVADVAKVLGDGATPERIRSTYDSGDGTHLSSAGQDAISPVIQAAISKAVLG